MPTFEHDGLSFHYLDDGEGLPFVFQHGLGSDVRQPAGVYTPTHEVRRIALDAQAHGETRPLGDVHRICLATIADDVVALLDALGVERAVVGGISMGAAVAMNLALRYPDRVLGLVLSRPAWIDRPLPRNARVFPHIAMHILHHGPERGLELFRQTVEYQALRAESPSCADSVEAQFLQPHAAEFIARLERLPHDTPCRDRGALQAIHAPALVLGNRQDPIHPWDFAQTIAGLIPGAELVELTPKSWSLERHNADVQAAIDDFLQRRFL